MKKILITAIMFTFVFSAAFATEGFKFSENFISELKAKSISADHDNHAVVKLNSKVRNHFTYISILRQDWTDELIMSLKSEIQTAGISAKGESQDDTGSPWEGKHSKRLNRITK